MRHTGCHTFPCSPGYQQRLKSEVLSRWIATAATNFAAPAQSNRHIRMVTCSSPVTEGQSHSTRVLLILCENLQHTFSQSPCRGGPAAGVRGNGRSGGGAGGGDGGAAAARSCWHSQRGGSSGCGRRGLCQAGQKEVLAVQYREQSAEDDLTLACLWDSAT